MDQPLEEVVAQVKEAKLRVVIQLTTRATVGQNRGVPPVTVNQLLVPIEVVFG